MSQNAHRFDPNLGSEGETTGKVRNDGRETKTFLSIGTVMFLPVRALNKDLKSLHDHDGVGVG